MPEAPKHLVDIKWNDGYIIANLPVKGYPITVSKGISRRLMLKALASGKTPLLTVNVTKDN